MKNMIKLLLGALFLTMFLFSCKKEENKVYFEGGTAPVFTASTTTNMVLDSTNAANTKAILFTWTNPDYKFNTGISSQDVTYILQIDTTGSNFTNPNIQEVSILNDLKLNPSVKEFNGYINKMGLKYGIPHNVEFRIKAALAGGAAVPLYSNVIKIVITSYLDVAIPVPNTGKLYITGDGVASDWTNNPPLSQICTQVSETEYTITIDLKPGKYYKFLTTLTYWQPQYGMKIGSGGSSSGGDLGLNNTVAPYDKDPEGIPTPAEAGSYKVTLNFITGKYKAEKI